MPNKFNHLVFRFLVSKYWTIPNGKLFFKPVSMHVRLFQPWSRRKG